MMATVRTMVERYPQIVVGTVSDQTGTQYLQSPSDLLSDPPLAGMPYVEFAVAIDEVISATSMSVGDRIPVLQEPGFGQDGVTANPRLLQVGGRYLFFLEDWGPYRLRGFGGYAAARFAISEDGRLTANGAECEYGGPSDISGITKEQCEQAKRSADPGQALSPLKGQTLKEAAARIRAAIAEAPLPAPPRPGVPAVTPSPGVVR
ncbi:MAG: hypothetical protein Q7T33_02385 [Dehalococcoidia bacterium]|nr:hypothetical protein [Dehalococcoidia bacterium]